MKTIFKHKTLVISVFLVLSCQSLSAFAGEEEDFKLLGDISLEDLMTLEVVEVTARKRTENLQDVPVSLSVMRGVYLDANTSGAMDVRFLNVRIPSLLVESSFGRTFPRFYLRGLGNTDFDLNASQPVSIVFDGVVQENPILKGFPVFDFDRIEVLRGPQGTLFGRNTPAGLIKFDSKKPTKEFDGYADLTFGSRGTTDFEGAIGGSLNQNWTGRFSLLNQQRDDWIDNAAPGLEQRDAAGGYDETAFRLQLHYQPDEQLSLLFNLHARDLDATPVVFRANILDLGSNSLNSNYDPDTVFLDGLGNTSQSVENTGMSIKMDYDFGRYTLTTITGYETVEILSRADVDGGYGGAFIQPEFGPGFVPFPAESADGIPDHSQFTQEIRIATNEHGKFDYQVGFFYFSEDLTIDSFSYDSLSEPVAGVQNGYSFQNQQTTAWAVFGSFDYDVTDKYKATFGIRYSSDKKDFIAERTQGPFGSGTVGPISVSPDDTHVSWDLSGVYEINDDINWYTRIAESFRAPSVQGRLTFGDEVTVADSETVLSFETGFKADVLDGRGRVNFSIYSFTMADQQITAVGGGSNFNRLINVKETKGQGFELDSELVLNRNWHLMANMSFNDTEINDANLFVPGCASFGTRICTLTDPLTDPSDDSSLVIIDGNNLPHSPEWIYNLALRYETEMAGGEFYFYTDWSYRSEIDIFLYRSVEFTSEALLEGGVRVGYRWTQGDTEYEVVLYGRNITDEEVLIGGVDFNNLTGIVNEPRFFGLEFKVSFL